MPNVQKKTKIIRGKQVDDRTGLSETQRVALERANVFPKRVQLGPRSHGYLEDEVEAWIENRRWVRDHPDAVIRKNDPVLLAQTERKT